MKDDLDRLLDSVLASYSVREPWPGIEERVLSRIETERRRGPAWRWLWAVPLAASLVVAALVWNSREPAPLPPQPKQPVAVAGPAPIIKPDRRNRLSYPGKEVPRRRFPTPAPLSREERALLAAIERPEVLAGLSSGPVRPIQIEEIQIEPLEE